MSRSKVIMNIQMLKTVTGYAHWIPITQGLHEEYFEENFPGWEWNDFVPRLLNRKILQFKGETNPALTQLSQGLYISSEIQTIEFIPQKNGVRVKIHL